MNAQPPLPPEVWITLAGVVDGAMTQRVFHNLSLAIQQGARKVHLLIQSPGGNIGDGVAIHNYCRNLPIEVVTYNAGQISSAAVVVYVSGQRRITEQTAAFMIHKTTNHPPSALRGAEFKALSEAALLDDERCKAIIQERAQIPRVKWKAMQLADITLSADQALSYGLAHEVGSFAPPRGAPLFNI